MKKRSLVSLSVLAAVSAVAPLASAQAVANQGGYAANNFEPSERGSDWFANESLDLRGNMRPAIGIVGDYGYRGVISAYNADGSVKASAVREQLLLHVGGSLVLVDRLRLGLSLPIQAYAFGHNQVVRGVNILAPQHEQSVGDLRVSADLRLFGVYGDPFTVGLGGSFWAPIGQRESFTGDGTGRFAPHLMVAGDVGPVAYALRASYQYRPLAENYIDTRIGSTFTWGGAAGVRVLDKKLLVGPELFGQTVVANTHAFQERGTPIELMGGAHLNVGDQLRVNAGFGTFLNKGYGAPVYRGLLGIEWFPGIETDRDKDGILDKDDACPDTPGVRTEDPKTNGCPPPPPDRDGDGVIDSEDACPDVKGVHTDDPKTNGCPPPPPDRDGDGIIDSEDACPDVKGVRTDDPKTNGCPGDRDKDGIIDLEDACPDVPGLHTSDPKTNGCPDTDRDKDGILNDVDACPDEPGPKSDDPKTSGCPRVFIQNKQIKILEQPKFDFNKSAIKKESDSLLTEVAKVMTDHLEIKHVRVEGHTDNVGDAAYNKKLSQQRAQAVVTWLTAHNIDKTRLEAKGMGKESPMVPNDTELNRALNRRVEFHIESQDTTTNEEVKTPSGGTITAPPATKPVPPGAAPTPKKDIPKK